MGCCEKLKVNRKKMQEVEKVNYLEVMIRMDGDIGEEVVDVFREGKFEFQATTDKKLKGNGVK